MNCQCNRCELGSEGHYTQWTCEYTGEHKKEWTEDGTDGDTTARVTLQIVIDVPDGTSIGEAVQQMVKCCPNAYCVEILLSEPTNLSAKELNEKQSYINRLSNTKQGDETND